jgi:3-phosphoshikimate 1-carboxyvinyltransferase
MSKHPSPLLPETGGDREPLSHLEDRLLKEERRVAEVLLRRTKLLGEIAARRREDKKKPGVGHALEKALWKIWQDLLQYEDTGQSNHWRQLVAQCNNLGYALGEQHSPQNQRAWVLRPIAPAKPIQLPGPVDMFTTKILCFWAAVTNTAMHLSPVVLNDGLIDLIKVLNQTGAGLSWKDEAVMHTVRQNRDLALENKTIHAGQHEFNFALMLALALGRPGITKFSGSGILNLLQLKPWQNVLPQLGARLHQLNPHAPGLPARLESSGQATRVVIDSDVPVNLIWALLAAAPFSPQGLHVTWPVQTFNKPELEALFLLFRHYTVPFTIESSGVFVSPAPPRLPIHPELCLDIGLCTLLLAWSRVSNQRMTLLGAWPMQNVWADRHLAILHSCGLKLQLGPDRIEATPGPWPTDMVLDIRGLPGALPLAVALALSSPRECMVLGGQSGTSGDVIEQLARLTNRAYIQDDHALHIRPLASRADHAGEMLEAPDAIWGMAMAMTSFKHPGLLLSNPGELTTLWPRFWSIYHHVLSVPRTRSEDQKPTVSENKADEASKKGKRRVRI